ncbi:MAG: peptidylprolyl isomerase [Gammaproteobacteria bacterium]|nr:peptidylprolyl isomerase [Gammaproteobacteria bacterium]MCY4200696.1 peptidylprolyl isomerase [Gammaproteobacteria bacterium]MCY4278986.1 peptidylprolyl isomerase [Gammaproteobacteria bacterium]MCY4322942.1 peptidylprolyl isomerase [Gammaproteobacteria bacterium]
MIVRLMRDPLLHVLLAGGFIYLLYAWTQPTPVDDDHIVVDESALASFIAKRAAMADMDAAGARLRAMREDDLDVLIKAFVREQALLREARRLGFDQEDYVMERRLVQRLEFALVSLAHLEARPSEEALRDFYAQHINLYKMPAHITFTHVYLNPRLRGENILEDAHRLLRKLREEAVDFADALRYGDQFLYHRNYVDRRYEDIADHFGADMATALFAGAPSLSTWSRPLTSTHGVHLVLVHALREAMTPPFETLRTTLARDYARERERTALDQAVQRIIDRQRVRIEVAADASGDE